MIAPIVVGVLAGFAGYAYLALRPPPPKVCGSPGGPPVTSPRVKLSDGRHLAYKERGTTKEEAKYKIIISHGFGDSKDFNLPISDELLKELQIYLLSFDRAGYGESDPNPKRSVKSDAIDIQELADKLQLGPKFSMIGISLGAYAVYGCLKYVPHRLSGAALVVPVVNYWWPCFPTKLAQETLKKMLFQDQRTLRIAHYAPWLFYWWMTQKWFPSLSSMEGKMDALSHHDIEIIKQLSAAPSDGQEKVQQQGVHESLYRDMIVSYSNWEFDPTDISNPFPNNEGSVHIWQGYDDKFIPFELNRYLSQQIPWIQYHEVRDAGHLLIHKAGLCEAIFKELISS
ncbi:Alpha beta-Hydrolases superfamily isoform 1 [Olea europaea subsp. europaea]|uniref:Alpha beta-Hydrolases superfamily isoform 1 n=1 Tax=Olea europaea subsp. europaea TaxID=158383 RepID=A0A8S0VNF7_OLEEU|nr:Alpha beta-Hydrolases superfamily isoform 1 [Olea europaea subsp. europaea]